MKYLIIGVLVLLLVGLVSMYDLSNDVEVENKPTNYYGLVELGLAPSTISRQPTEHDIDTGIKFKDGDKIYSLIESRNWNTLDYGKTFIVRIA